MAKLKSKEAKRLLRYLNLLIDPTLNTATIINNPNLFNRDEFLKIIAKLNQIGGPNCSDCDEHLFDISFNLTKIIN